MRINLKSKKALAVGVAVTVLSGGAAYAYWTAGGTGTGTAATDTATGAVTVVQTSVLNEMYPGDAAQTLSGTFTNPNEGPVYVGTVTVSIASVTKAGAAAVGCSSADYTLAANPITISAEVLANDTSPWTGATIQFNNTGANQDGCKGATVNLAYAVA
jgi:hypothetical protein